VFCYCEAHLHSIKFADTWLQLKIEVNALTNTVTVQKTYMITSDQALESMQSQNKNLEHEKGRLSENICGLKAKVKKLMSAKTEAEESLAVACKV
jgi:hypothetical protein